MCICDYVCNCVLLPCVGREARSLLSIGMGLSYPFTALTSLFSLSLSLSRGFRTPFAAVPVLRTGVAAFSHSHRVFVPFAAVPTLPHWRCCFLSLSQGLRTLCRCAYATAILLRDILARALPLVISCGLRSLALRNTASVLPHGFRISALRNTVSVLPHGFRISALRNTVPILPYGLRIFALVYASGIDLAFPGIPGYTLR